MDIAFHIGANSTDEDRLLKTLLKNAEMLGASGVKAPGPGKYRSLIRETIQQLDGAPPPPETRDVLLDAILDDETPDRLVMSHPMFICIANRIFDKGIFYQQTEFKVRGLRALFPDDALSLFMAIRNPATWLPLVYGDSKANTFTGYMKGFHPKDILWSDIVKRIRHAVPDAPLTVWCNEDTPLIWADLIAALTGIAQGEEIKGEFELLADIMHPEGMERFDAYLRAHPPETPEQKHKIISAFLSKYARPEAIEDEIDLPEITPIIDDLTARYEADIETIGAMKDVTFIAA